MADVDPFVIQWPRKWLEDPEVRPAIEYLNMHLFQQFIRTGGGDDAIAAGATRETYPWDYSDTSAADNAALQSLFSSLIPEVKEWRAVTVTQNYTALDHNFINAKSGSTITFPQYPSEGAAITIRNGDGTRIKLAGNGKKLNGETTGIINNKGTAVDFYYFIDADEWFAR